MKLKKIMVLLVLALVVFLIYLTTLDKKVYYLSIGDYLTTGSSQNYAWNKELVQELKEKHKFEIYINQFSNMNLRTTDLIYQIQNNEKRKIQGKEKSIKNALIKADLVTLSVGMNDLLYKMNMDIDNIDMEELYNYVDETIKDNEELLKLVREYCKEDIFMINYYVPRNITSDKAIKMIYYANKKLEELTTEYHIELIDISTFSTNSDFFNDETAYLSEEGEEHLAELMKKEMRKTLLK